MIQRGKLLQCSNKVKNRVCHKRYFVLGFQTGMRLKMSAFSSPARGVALGLSCSLGARVNSATQSSDVPRNARGVDKRSARSVTGSVEEQRWQLARQMRQQRSFRTERTEMCVCEQQRTFVTSRGCGVNRVEQPWLQLTVKHLVPGDEGHPHALAAVFHQVLKVQFALLDEVLLHLRRAAGVSLRTEAQVLTCGGRGEQTASVSPLEVCFV